MAVTINEGPVDTFYGFYDTTATGPLLNAGGIDTTKVPIHFNANGGVKFVRFNVTTTTSGDIIPTKIGTDYGCRVLAIAAAFDYTDPTASVNGTGTTTFGGVYVPFNAVNLATGGVTVGTTATRTYNLLIWYR